ncbi:hypothetical protein ICW_04030 [Bacillus wiedmannii]|uniref:MFS transporter n=1 Tax=Bacillus wiedmannii TaxID=1890302 RepID=A0AB37YNS5_9BACI|nr:hypothetical protein ICW_04030 [Bacillus wiedmannii]EJV67642.1 hypothetical protein IEO_01196 [Bacillus wiedmannii]OFD11419.1 hypothetical protein BTGOE6_10480 [Bacillus wiedmannii]SCC13323.1 Uncharacterized protein BC10311_01739 [Bacillus wiedmannii]
MQGDVQREKALGDAGIITVLIPWLFNVHHHFEAYVYGLGMASSGVGAVIAA